MDPRTFLLKIRQKRVTILLIAMVVFLATSVYVRLFIEHGRAEVSIQILTTPIIRSGDNVEIYRNIFESNELIEKEHTMIYSDEMTAYLCKQLNLYKYYDVNPDDEYAFETISHMIGERCGMDKKAMNVIVLTYRDRDPRLAANLLNAMVTKLDEMNRNAVNEMILANVEVYYNIGESLSRRLDMQQIGMKQKLQQVDSLLESPNRRNNTELYRAQLSLYKETAQLDNLQNEITFAYNKYKLAQNAIEKSSQKPMVSIISRPMPSTGFRNWVTLSSALTGSLIAILLYVIIYYYSNAYEWELRTLFGK